MLRYKEVKAGELCLSTQSYLYKSQNSRAYQIRQLTKCKYPRMLVSKHY